MGPISLFFFYKKKSFSLKTHNQSYFLDFYIKFRLKHIINSPAKLHEL